MDMKKIITVIIISIVCTSLIFSFLNIKGAANKKNNEETVVTSPLEYKYRWEKRLTNNSNEYFYEPVRLNKTITCFLGKHNFNTTIYSVNDEGKTTWNEKLKGSLQFLPKVSTDRVLIPIWDDVNDKSIIYCYSVKGNLKWTYEINNSKIISKRAISFDNGDIFIGAEKNLLKLSKNGQLLEKREIKNGNILLLEKENNKLITCTQKSLMYLNDTLSTKSLKLFRDELKIVDVSYTKNEGLYMLYKNKSKGYFSNHYICKLNKKGDIYWNHLLNNSGRAVLIKEINTDLEGNIYFTKINTTAWNQKLIAINKQGKVKWKYTFGLSQDPKSRISTPIISKDYDEILVFAGDITYESKGITSFYSFSLDGTLNWGFKPEKFEFGTATIGRNGSVFTVSKGKKAYSFVDFPSKPLNLMIETKNKSIFIRWDEPRYKRGGKILDYKIYKGSKKGELSLFEKINGTCQRYTDHNISFGDTFYYKLRAVSSKGEGEKSNLLKVTLKDTTPPTADAGEDQTVKVDEEVTFNASGSLDNVGITSHEWDFDDGTTATGETVDHKFDEKGTYEVTLTVTDEAGNTDTDTVTVTVEKKDDNGGNRIPGFSIILLSLSISLAVLNKYRKRTD